MAIMQMSANCPRPMTAQEEQHARLVGALICCAKMLQAATVISATASEERDVVEKLSLETSALLCSIVGLYGHDGKRMETEALELANLLGFNIEQHYISQPAGGIH